MDEWDNDGKGLAVIDREKEEQKDKVKPPPLYAVVFWNDDYTTMEMVVDILVQYFSHTLEDAQRIMLAVHCQGKGVAGIYTRDIAETKAAIATSVAQEAEQPLKVTVEEA